MPHGALFLENENIIEVDCLADVSTVPPSAIESGEVRVTLQDSAGVDITSFTWPLNMTNVGGGKYQATIPTTPNLIDGPTGTVTAFIEVTSPVIATWRAPVAVTRRSL